MAIYLRDYQNTIAEQARIKLLEYGLVYLAMGMRTGKTVTSLHTCNLLLGCMPANVLFVTKKKVIDDIKTQAKELGCKFNLDVINYESLHKLDPKYYDVIILDEAHCCFLGNTKVGGKKIKDIAIGDYQKSFNFVENKYENKKVINVFKNKLSEDLIKITCNGKEIICTESHEIYTQRGWVIAGEILPTDKLQVV